MLAVIEHQTFTKERRSSGRSEECSTTRKEARQLCNILFSPRCGEYMLVSGSVIRLTSVVDSMCTFNCNSIHRVNVELAETSSRARNRAKVTVVKRTNISVSRKPQPLQPVEAHSWREPGPGVHVAARLGCGVVRQVSGMKMQRRERVRFVGSEELFLPPAVQAPEQRPGDREACQVDATPEQRIHVDVCRIAVELVDPHAAHIHSDGRMARQQSLRGFQSSHPTPAHNRSRRPLNELVHAVRVCRVGQAKSA